MKSRGWKLAVRDWSLEVRSWRLLSNLRLPVYSLILLLSLFHCTNSKTSDQIKFDQYYVQGEQLYMKHCSNCHQKDGNGLRLVYPPLNQSDFIENNFEKVICLMKYGIEGELIVNGKRFNQPMPGVASLTDIEIAEIATYVYNSWGHEKKDITLSQVSDILRNCSEQ